MSHGQQSDQKAEILKITDYKRHIVFCTGPECCKSAVGDELWNHLKKRLLELGLAAPAPGSGEVYRTKAKCLRICADGPIAVVYPEGIWYRFIDRLSLDRIVEQHLRDGKPVQELIWNRNNVIGKS